MILMMFTFMMVAYLASSMALDVTAGQNVLSVGTLLMTISIVFIAIFFRAVGQSQNCALALRFQYFSVPPYGFVALQHNEYFVQTSVWDSV